MKCFLPLHRFKDDDDICCEHATCRSMLSEQTTILYFCVHLVIAYLYVHRVAV